jgi:hydroxymethylglutaryl-CoA lyase
MTNSVQLIECPRDAWQGLPAVIPTEAKAEYLRALINAGFMHIDAVSFVSPRAVPQMADSAQVLSLLNSPRSVEIIAIVVNAKGAERAIQTEAVTTLGFPHSISPEFLRRNQNQTIEESLATLQSIADSAHASSLNVVAYLSMAFGNPYNDPWSIEQVIAACQSIVGLGVRQLSLADTVGLAMPQQIADTFSAVRSAIAPEIELGLHLHARPQDAAEKIRAGYLAGCRRFDTSLGGFGGCPFAQDALVGNIATETARAELARLGAELPPITETDSLIAQAQSIHTSYAHA